MRLALEKFDVPVNDLSVVFVAYPVKDVVDSLSVVIPVVEVQGFGFNVAVNFGVKFDFTDERFAPLNTRLAKKPS